MENENSENFRDYYRSETPQHYKLTSFGIGIIIALLIVVILVRVYFRETEVRINHERFYGPHQRDFIPPYRLSYPDAVRFRGGRYGKPCKCRLW